MCVASRAASDRNQASTLSRDETYGTHSRIDLIAALALAGRVPEPRGEARLLVAGNPDWRISELAANSPFRSMSA